MRFYNLKITEQKNPNKVDAKYRKTSNRPFAQTATLGVGNKTLLHLSSYVKRDPNGPGWVPGFATDRFDPGALDIQFQFTENSLTTFDASSGAANITIKGVDIATVKAAENLRGKTVSLYAGMGRGLPLSKPEQSGEILLGTVMSSVGNWEGTDLSLTLYVLPYIVPPEQWGTPIAPGLTPTGQQPVDNLQFHCRWGEDLTMATKQALKAAATNYRIDFKIPNAVRLASREYTGRYHSLKDLCVGIGRIWKESEGLDLAISIRSNSLVVTTDDHTKKAAKVPFEELMGQPAWNGPTEISFTTAMRADICVGDLVELPNISEAGLIMAQNSAAIFALRQHSLFAGTYVVRTISHLGQFRSPDGLQWASTFTCYPKGPKAKQ
ncbi:hypothetical protein AL01_01225 [Bombella intestini]|uniref:Uncharacterized protein n=1 Tax=Bombella intestini TaxID=1539051 RepID=A0A1S8GS08_9PROT|nr:hypothetical protein [Bombella intestini]OOL19628.1 hypothetical protein AL01_01225 [Bombella intestini]